MEYNLCWFILIIFNSVFSTSFVQGRNEFGYMGRGFGIGSACEYDDDCVPAHSYCHQQQICECRRGYMQSQDGSECLTTVGASCDTQYDCTSLLHSECRKESCQCEQRYIPNQGGTECLPIASYRGDCKLDSQCKSMMGDGSYCNQGRCECLPRHHFSNIESRCFYSKRMFETCRNSSECYVGESWSSNVACIGGQCNCRSGYYFTEDGRCERNSSLAVRHSLTILLLTVLLNFLN
ncbi:uncharacterized protein LOC142325393 isoform X2 [Lycorma delicatula]|uniref:uncharacterized protein LOC142325393 isoform X2 n=1 Tax=Lycorma delicatula TaxID=130591 RepID=UPI003F519AAE